IENKQDAADVLVEFNYELDFNHVPKKSAFFATDPDAFFLSSGLVENEGEAGSGLDFTFVALQTTGTQGESLATYKPVALDGNMGKVIKGEACAIIQHPSGLPKKVVLKDIGFFSETENRLIYESDTLPGSSGSMVIGLGTCEVIALHHCGLPKTDSQNRILTKSGALAEPGTPDEEIEWIGNAGIKISKIIQALEEADLPAQMEAGRSALLGKTHAVAEELRPGLDKTSVKNAADQPGTAGRITATVTDFLITLVNTPVVINRVEVFLAARYGQAINLSLSMPAMAEEDAVELFSFSAPISVHPDAEAMELVKFPDILNAEPDLPLRLNTGTAGGAQDDAFLKESITESDDGLGQWDEADFLEDYRDSPYVKNKTREEWRSWNHAATKFDRLFINGKRRPDKEKLIRLVQFDTGFTDHSKVEGGFDTDIDFSFLNNTDNAEDPRTVALGKQPGHGTRTGSLLIGNPSKLPASEDQHNGNFGLLPDDARLVPYRIAESVILINRQKQLAAALDRALSQGFDIITMSMGLPPTIATAKMAKKAYDKGVIWCCAAGNEVQAVVSPAVFPGTIAIAASNPLDSDWKGSSRGDMVDITAPGEDVYVPIWNKDRMEDYAYGNGTSYATPHVAAAAAYWLAAYYDQLSAPEYAGWRRVEAFRNALTRSARKKNNLPGEGFGAGILDANKLLDTPPLAASRLEYAYNNWNEHAFFAALQGYGELAKTYWNWLHDRLFGRRRSMRESLYGPAALTPYSRDVEEALFSAAFDPNESVGKTGQGLMERYREISSRIINAAK
ncbi:MAG TPA: S8/S53 family peptidase, partial [Flavisolibacter sp.]|nr:S8/S53 family peptidase [Flavisolibacter sp.]